jgi:hypothetical protein
MSTVQVLRAREKSLRNLPLGSGCRADAAVQLALGHRRT